MSDRFDLHLRYPELFEPLTEEQRRNVMQPLASSWLEGDNPTREDVALLIDYELGRIRRIRPAGTSEGARPPGADKPKRRPAERSGG